MESLRPDRELLDPNFEGYKLSIDPLNLSSTTLVSAVNDVTLRDELLISFQHMRAFGNLNHLLFDSWTHGGKTEAVYFVDENYEVQRAAVKDKEISSVDAVFKIPTTEKTKESLNATLFFPSPSLACLSDGCGKLFLLHTEGRACAKDVPQNAPWKVATVYQFNRPSLILHAIHSQESESVSCLLLSITENAAATSVKDAHVIHLELITFSQAKCSSSGAVSYSCEVIRHFTGYSAPVYAAIEPGCTAVLVASDKPFSLVKDDRELPLAQDTKDKEMTGDKEPNSATVPVYRWSQDNEDVTVRFEIPDGTTKEKIACEIKADSLDIHIGEDVLLSGPLFAKVNSDESTWTFDTNSLELVLVKQAQEHHWSSVVKGDDRGKYELVGEEAERVKEIHSRLEHLTSDKIEESRQNKMSFTDQQLEECDAFPEDIEYIFRLDATTGEVTHKVCLAIHQWIFNVTLDQSLPPAFCIRHDVDALLWQPKAHSSSDYNWTHIGTFNALGYVQAAKRDRKFSTCAPDMSFATLCDCTRHVYVYQQSEHGAKHASQHVVTLTTPDNEILGLQASNGRVFVLTKQSLHAVTVK